MKEFDELLEVSKKLLGPNGCKWDQTQTFLSLQPYVLEEAHEVIEAVDRDQDPEIIEELGDLLYTVVFYARLAEKMGRFTMKEIIEAIRTKLIRRHPHVFSEVSVSGVDEIIANWEEIKKKEKEKKGGGGQIPPTLPAIARAQKVARKMERSKVSWDEKSSKKMTSEEEVGEALFQSIAQAERLGIDAEGALRRALHRYEAHLRTLCPDSTS